MAHVIEMPKLSDTMEEGGIANWLKKEGDTVNEGEALVEIETDKATQEFESPEEGTILKILVQPGKTVPLRTPIAVIGAKGEKVDLAALTGGKGEGDQRRRPAGRRRRLGQGGRGDRQSAETGRSRQDGGGAERAHPWPRAAAAPEPTGRPAPAAASAAQAGEQDGRTRSSPLARKSPPSAAST